MRACVRACVRAWVGGWAGESVMLYLMDTIATTVFDQSFSKFTCKLWTMRGDTLLNLGHGVKQNRSTEGCLKLKRSVDNVKVNFCTLYIRPCGHDTDYRFRPITFKLHMQVVDEEWRNPIDFWSQGSKGQGQLWHFLNKTLWAGYRLQFLPNHFQTSHVSCG